MDNLLKVDNSVTIPELAAFLTFNMAGFTGLDPAFASTELALAASSETKTQTFKLAGKGKPEELFAEVNPDPNKVSFTQSQVVWFIHNRLAEYDEKFGILLLMQSGSDYFTVLVRRHYEEDTLIILYGPNDPCIFKSEDFYYLVTPNFNGTK